MKTLLPTYLFVVLFWVCLLFVTRGGYGPDTAINFSGYIPVHNNERHLFYWFFESRKNPSQDPFLVWLTGGPGCSSMLALMVENGPYHVEDDLSLSINNYSWTDQANVMWIDQPSQTGYSYDDLYVVDGVYTEDEVADDLYEFIQKFFQTYTKYNKLDFYVTGESYAGHYVPHFSKKIFDMNQQLGPNDIYINLKGFSIGDGLVDPLRQYPGYPPYARDNELVGPKVSDMMEACLPFCEAGIYECNANNSGSYTACLDAYDICNLCEVEPVSLTGINLYDIRQPCTYPPLCYNFNNVDQFFNEPSTIQALGADKNWVECNRMVELGLVFAGDWMLDFQQDIPPMLMAGIQALIYHGNEDYIVNWYGGYDWVSNLQWSYQREWNKAYNLTWMVNGQEAGSYKSYGGLTFLKVLNAGHMVPMDQPYNALAMIQEFTLFGFNATI